MQAPPTSRIAQRTVGEIVAEDFRLGSVFKRYGIDFCCGGGRTVASACETAGITVQELEEALQSPPRTNLGQSMQGARDWPLDFLTEYIANVHHSYVRKTLPILLSFSTKVAKVHGDANPELHEIAALVKELTDDLTSHLEDEETLLFPYVKQLVAADIQALRPSRPDFATAKNPITAMEHEHEGAAAILSRIRNLSGGYRPPAHACNTYRALFATLEEFENDLHHHVHLENNVLFPRALSLEASLLGE